MAIIIDSKSKEQMLRVVNDDHAIQTLPETSADQVMLEDTGNKFTSTNVEGALSEVAKDIADLKTGLASAGKVDDVQDVNGASIVTNKIAKLSKAAVGLGNVENTADADKSVKHATSADSATKATKDGGGNIISDTYATKQALQDSIAGKAKSFSYDNYQKFVEAVNAFSDTQMAVNDNVLIVTLGVPDMWVKSKNATKVTYTYATDEAIIASLNTTAGLTVGYYTFAQLETTKVDLSTYQTKTDNTLETTSKDVVGAINEVKTKADANEYILGNIINGNRVVPNAEHANAADNATNVTTNINGKAITSIFETDGVTAKNATHAGSADEATSARSADVVANRLKVSGQDSLGRATEIEYDGAAAKEVAFNSTDFTGTGATNKYTVELATVYMNEAHIETIAGTYTAVSVNSKGVVQNGGRSIAFIEAGENIPADVMIGGLVFRKKA